VKPLLSTVRQGFTLIEVLVALVIVAVGVAAVLGALTSAASSTIYMRDKTFAHWIALNRITELRLAGVPTANGKVDGALDYADRRWQWQQEIAPLAGIAGLQQVIVRVRAVAGTEKSATPAAITDQTNWMVEDSGFLGAQITISAPQPFWEP
jgi:general secretion pathway protein I